VKPGRSYRVRGSLFSYPSFAWDPPYTLTSFGVQHLFATFGQPVRPFSETFFGDFIAFRMRRTQGTAQFLSPASLQLVFHSFQNKPAPVSFLPVNVPNNLLRERDRDSFIHMHILDKILLTVIHPVKEKNAWLLQIDLVICLHSQAVAGENRRAIMSSISLRLSESLHKRVRELAKKEGVSINQLISSALAEKISALMTVEYLQKRAARGSRKSFERALSKVKDSEPRAEDRI
jgi:hypothetical protein